MIKKYIIITILFIYTISSFACLNTYQFKIFPVGINNDVIICVDIKILRTSEEEGSHRLRLGLNSTSEMKEMWIIYAYISEYDQHQKIISNQSVGRTYSLGKSYADSLFSIYSLAYNEIINQNPNIELFLPEYISFCDFQQNCELIKLSSDSSLNENSIIFENLRYSIDVLGDTSYYAFKRDTYHPKYITELYVSSVRVYKTPNMKLVLSHLATGHEISMGWIKNDPDIVKEKESKDETVILAKEHKPNIAFKEIKNSVYEEPLLHHGYGFDVFFIARGL